MFLFIPFTNIWKRILTNLKIPGKLFLLIPFFKYFKKHTYQSENTCDNFCANILFPNIKKNILTSQKNTWDIFFAHTLFQIYNIAYLRMWKIPGIIFLRISFVKYLKKHTYESEKNLGRLFCQYLFSNI